MKILEPACLIVRDEKVHGMPTHIWLNRITRFKRLILVTLSSELYGLTYTQLMHILGSTLGTWHWKTDIMLGHALDQLKNENMIVPVRMLGDKRVTYRLTVLGWLKTQSADSLACQKEA